MIAMVHSGLISDGNGNREVQRENMSVFRNKNGNKAVRVNINIPSSGPKNAWIKVGKDEDSDNQREMTYLIKTGISFY